jgi:hypothetical protein
MVYKSPALRQNYATALFTKLSFNENCTINVQTVVQATKLQYYTKISALWSYDSPDAIRTIKETTK